VAGATVTGAVTLGGLVHGIGVAGADPADPALPAQQAAATGPSNDESDSQKEQEQQAEPVHDNGFALAIEYPRSAAGPVRRSATTAAGRSTSCPGDGSGWRLAGPAVPYRCSCRPPAAAATTRGAVAARTLDSVAATTVDSLPPPPF